MYAIDSIPTIATIASNPGIPGLDIGVGVGVAGFGVSPGVGVGVTPDANVGVGVIAVSGRSKITYRSFNIYQIPTTFLDRSNNSILDVKNGVLNGFLTFYHLWSFFLSHILCYQV